MAPEEPGVFWYWSIWMRTREAGAVIAQMPAGRVVIGGASEGASAEDEEIATAVEEIGDGGPGCFGNDGALREDQKAGLRIV